MTWVTTLEAAVETDWLDELDHVNFLSYQRIADIASMEIWRRARESTTPASSLEFVMTETHVRYLRELRLGDRITIRTALVASDAKRFQLLHHIESAGELSCTVETLNLCFDATIRRVAPFPEAMSSYFTAWGGPPNDAAPQLSISRKPVHV